MNEIPETNAQHVTRLLAWITQHGGAWASICTPKSDTDYLKMDMQTMRDLIDQLSKESFGELILVMLMVHRQQPYVKALIKYLLLDLLEKNWCDNNEQITKLLADSLI